MASDNLNPTTKPKKLDVPAIKSKNQGGLDKEATKEQMIMDNHVNKDIRDSRVELSELHSLLREAEQQNNDPEAEIAARHFRYLIKKRLRGNTLN